MKKIIVLLLVFLVNFHLYAQGDVEMVDSDDANVEQLDINPNELDMTEAEFNKKFANDKRFKKLKDLQAQAHRPQGSVHSEADKKNLQALLKQVQHENRKVIGTKGNGKKRKVLRRNLSDADQQKLLQQLAKSDQKAILAKLFTKGKSKQTMEMLLAPYRQMGYSKVHLFLEKRFAETKFGGFAQGHPWVYDIMSKLFVDKRALPELVSVVERRAHLALVVGINIAIFIFGFLIARYKKKFPFFSMKRFLYFIFRLVLLNGLRIGVLIYFFGHELDPAFQIIWASL